MVCKEASLLVFSEKCNIYISVLSGQFTDILARKGGLSDPSTEICCDSFIPYKGILLGPFIVTRISVNYYGVLFCYFTA